MEKLYTYKTSELESSLANCVKNGVTELYVHDDAIANDKGKLLRFLKTLLKEAPDLFLSILVNPKILDADVCRTCMNINCSIELPFEASSAASKKSKDLPPLLFDKKFYSRRSASLNNSGLVFGIQLFFADKAGDSIKAFADRLNFTVEQYPNHIDFPQIEDAELLQSAKVSGTFSAEDIRYARNIAFACRTFYSAGRAVPWFISVLKALKMPSYKFFSDFSEWQRVNNCDYKSGFVPEDVSHQEIEKMQLNFLSLKFEEKNLSVLFPVVRDIVRINGAFSRLVSDGKEITLETQYNPDDLLGPESMDIVSFSNDVCMEASCVHLFLTDQGPDYRVV
ncbi:MAG: hypothetical protein K6F15_03760 [Treponema sp.]|nr:hypothetical protein [Treponema sp.]